MEVDDEPQLLEEKLAHLSEYDNLTQLHILIEEVDRMLDHAIQPHILWFERRIDYVIAYSALNWRDLQQQSFDPYLAEFAQRVIQTGQRIMDDWSVGPLFDISDYYTMLHTVDEIRAYYYEHYAKDETDPDLFGMIAGMERL